MTLTLMAIDVIVFLFLQPASLQNPPSSALDRRAAAVQETSFTYRWGVIPCEVRHNRSLASGVRCGTSQPPRSSLPSGKVVLVSLLTAMFIHASVLHLAGNMLFLWVFGANVEDRLGHAAFLLLYLATGVAATITYATFHWGSAVPLLGASGAIAGVMGAYLVFRPRARVLTAILWQPFQVVHLPAWTILGLFFVTQFLTSDQTQVAWLAHAGGMVAGALVALPVALVDRARRRAASPSVEPNPAPWAAKA
ncbi:MAG: rhomboid family intramembrane serine protease [Actinobacteria bacterium]|nr:rhomboid family intramembrane serine protease [Actinomycetota bacterium]